MAAAAADEAFERGGFYWMPLNKHIANTMAKSCGDTMRQVEIREMRRGVELLVFKQRRRRKSVQV